MHGIVYEDGVLQEGLAHEELVEEDLPGGYRRLRHPKQPPCPGDQVTAEEPELLLVGPGEAVLGRGRVLELLQCDQRVFHTCSAPPARRVLLSLNLIKVGWGIEGSNAIEGR
jgi:hypothetical protein